MLLTQSGTVAENRRNCGCSTTVSCTQSRIQSTSSLKPISSMRSASSSTRHLSSEKSLRLPLSRWSMTRPVVPTRMSTPLRSCLACSEKETPPYTGRTLYSFLKCFKSSRVLVIYIANSLVGARMIAYVFLVWNKSLALKYSTSGRLNPRVLPDPVRSRTIISFLS